MDLVRKFVERWYEGNRDRLFRETDSNPEIAHEKFVKLARGVCALGLEGVLLNCPENNFNPRFEISNAAGFNKNGLIPPKFLKALGFNRVVVGTVTYDPFEGNKVDAGTPKRIWRFPQTNSMVNWLGLPGLGARRVAEIQEAYGDHGVPITVNIMSTPGKKGEDLLFDLVNTIKATRHLSHLDTYQLNISCPNTHSNGLSIAQYRVLLSDMLGVVECELPRNVHLEVKLSPDMVREEIDQTVDVVQRYNRVTGFVTCNSTTNHDKRYIPVSPGKGGASGDAVYDGSFAVQKMVVESLKERGMDLYVRACGGISSAEKVRERVDHCPDLVMGVEVLTSLIMKGPRVMRELRAA